MDYKIAKKVLQEAVSDLHTISDFIRWTASNFEQAKISFGHGTDNAWDEAVNLILDTLSMPKGADPGLYNCRLTSTEKKTLISNIEQRINDRKPLAYITKRAWFAEQEYYVDERVLIPRSPIAELIDNHFEPWLISSPLKILDLCTGSGCIALACAMAFPDAEVDASDLSEDALAVASINRDKLGLIERCNLIHSDLFNNLKGRKYDLIVSNPPYVDALDMSTLPIEYHFEPELGLQSGEDGLDITRKILSEAANYLNENGILIVEVGNSAPALELAFPHFPFTWLEFEHGGDGVFMLDKSQLTMLAL